MADTTIEWCVRPGTRPKTWNPTRGCEITSPGCARCYAMRTAHRFSGKGGKYEGLTVLTGAGPIWNGEARLVHEMLLAPLSWRQPCTVFVNSMSDLFYEQFTDEEIAVVFGVMAACPQHTFIVLTKRAERMPEWFKWCAEACAGRFHAPAIAHNAACWLREKKLNGDLIDAAISKFTHVHHTTWPMRNVWIGVSTEDQRRADERIPHLMKTPAAVRFVSAEPLLGKIDLRRWIGRYCGCSISAPCDDWTSGDPCVLAPKTLDWLIVGGESGPGSRAFNVEWARALVKQCDRTPTKCFVKQLGALPVDRNDAGFDGDELSAWPADTQCVDLEARGYQGAPVRIVLRDRKGGDIAEWPEDLRVRQFPEVRG